MTDQSHAVRCLQYGTLVSANTGVLYVVGRLFFETLFVS
jgi:hypothetical protein